MRGKTMGRILLVDDDESLLRVSEYNLTREGHTLLCARSAGEGLDLLSRETVDLVVTDLEMPGMKGPEFLSRVAREYPSVLSIVITAYGSVESAVDAMKRGAYDYITKPFDRETLSRVVSKALEVKELRDENIRLRRELREKFGPENIIGESEAIEKIKGTISRLAEVDSTVLLTGESGTGKELVARAIHYNSSRATKSFVVVNCPAIPEPLMESELFGHEKGAFTGAFKAKTGKLELADGGTIFFDEIGDLKGDMQAKLLRVLQEKTIDKVGGTRPIRVDVRFVVATNRDLGGMVARGEFREDLYYRVSVIPISIPPLRERRVDIPLLVRHLLRQFGAGNLTVEPGAMEILEKYPWPGNVRELKNCIERALVLRAGPDRLAVSDLPVEMVEAAGRSATSRFALPEEGIDIGQLEKDLILQALEKTGWNQTKAGALLGLTRQTLIYRMEKHGIPRKRPGEPEA
jgi:DNA-binding NtrC family response regulator